MQRQSGLTDCTIEASSASPAALALGFQSVLDTVSAMSPAASSSFARPNRFRKELERRASS
jgi:hypothetical protein